MAEIPKPRSQPKSGNFMRSRRLPSMLRHKLMPGAAVWVKAKSIHPSLSKSNATTPTAGVRFAVAIEIEKACSGARAGGLGPCTNRRDDERLLLVRHRDCGRRRHNATASQLGEREASLIAVPCSEWRA